MPEELLLGRLIPLVSTEEESSDGIDPECVAFVHRLTGFAHPSPCIPEQQFVTEAMCDFVDDFVEEENVLLG